MSGLLELGEERFVSLTTYRRSGTPVSTPVWVVRDGDALVVTTPSDSGKVKRLRHTSGVALVPCDRRGRVAAGAEPRLGFATVEERDRPDLFLAKYRAEYRIFMLVERLFAKGARDRVLLRITPA